LFVESINEAGLFQLGDHLIVDELLGLRARGRRMIGEVEHGLHRRH
jgi:hypothetical protein